MSRKNTNQPEYGTELKLAAVRRVLAGESVRAVAQELGIRRKRLYVWKDRYAELGEAGLARRGGGRPRKVVPEDRKGPDAMSGRGELLAARKRIAELERTVLYYFNRRAHQLLTSTIRAAIRDTNVSGCDQALLKDKRPRLRHRLTLISPAPGGTIPQL